MNRINFHGVKFNVNSVTVHDSSNVRKTNGDVDCFIVNDHWLKIESESPILLLPIGPDETPHARICLSGT